MWRIFHDYAQLRMMHSGLVASGAALVECDLASAAGWQCFA